MLKPNQLAMLVLLITSTTTAQVKVGDITPNHPSAIFEIETSDKGLLIPRLKSSARIGIPSPATGLLVYDTDLKGFYGFNGTNWAPLDYSLPSGSLVLGSSANDANLLNNNFSFVGKIYTNSQNTSTITAAANIWYKASEGLQARAQTQSLKAGNEVLIWGGYNDEGGFNDGALYNPLTDTWRIIRDVNEGFVRNLPCLAWTGSKLIIWGGYYFNGSANIYLNTGYIYDPATEVYTPMSGIGAPSGRFVGAAEFNPATNEFIIWGGDNGTAAQSGNGGKYNINTDSWTSITLTNAPTSRSRTAYAIGNGKLMVWGGYTSGPTYLANGAVYDIASNTWTTMTASPLAGRYLSDKAEWTGTQFIIWGGTGGSGAIADGARYDPIGNSWTAINNTGAPTPTSYARTALANNKLFVMGGSNKGYDLTSNTWSDNVGSLQSPLRIFMALEATSSALVIYGGTVDSSPGTIVMKSGYRYFWGNPSITTTVSTPQFLYLYRKI